MKSLVLFSSGVDNALDSENSITISPSVGAKKAMA